VCRPDEFQGAIGPDEQCGKQEKAYGCSPIGIDLADVGASLDQPEADEPDQ
jgi:hypothetical protein